MPYSNDDIPVTGQCGAALRLQKDRDELMAFYDFPTEHWESLRTTNPIESTFATIRHCQRRFAALAGAEPGQDIGAGQRQVRLLVGRFALERISDRMVL